MWMWKVEFILVLCRRRRYNIAFVYVISAAISGIYSRILNRAARFTASIHRLDEIMYVPGAADVVPHTIFNVCFNFIHGKYAAIN